MADISSTPAPVANDSLMARQLGQLWTLVILSLIINAVLVTLMVIGAIMHHHQMKEGAGEPGGPGGPPPGWARAERERGPMGPREFRGGFRGDFGGGGDRNSDRGGMPGMGLGMGPRGGNPPDPAQMSQMVMNHLTQILSLTDDQKAKIKPVIDQQVAEFQKQREAERASTQKQMEEAKAKIKPLLNADQQKQLDAIRIPGGK